MALANVTTSHHGKTYRCLHVTKVADYLRIMRVVSLVPSWTEFLHDLDVDVVGQTKFCVRPASKFRTVPRIGGTKNVKVQDVLALKPDLVVANLEENDKTQVEALVERLPEGVLLTDVRTVPNAWTAMAQLGERVDRTAQACDMVNRIQDAWGEPRAIVGQAGYAVWSSPWMVAGHDTFIHDVMRHWGIGNAIDGGTESRYPTTGEDPERGTLAARQWLLPSEPFPFQPKHLPALHAAHPEARFRLVDGEAFSWYGSRMLHVTAHLREVAKWVAETA